MINTAVLYPGFNILKRGEISIILTNVDMAFDHKNDVPVIPYGLQRQCVCFVYRDVYDIPCSRNICVSIFYGGSYKRFTAMDIKWP